MDHWLPILREHGCLTECHLNQFTAAADWVPLYILEGLWKHLLAALSAFVNTGSPSLTAVLPPKIHVGTDKEFLLRSFHQHECLMRQSISIGGRRRQLAFCPYCGVVNENSETTLSHVRKHLDLLFVCGGCYTKSFPHGQALNRHMRTLCCSMLAIREKTRALLVSPIQTTQGSRELSLETSIEASSLPSTWMWILCWRRSLLRQHIYFC